jgi:lipoprotein-releasing system permease protein
MYFVQNPTRVRKFEISGIYNTALTDFDKLFVMGDIKHIQSLNSWQNKQVGGVEIVLNNFNNLELITKNIYEKIPYNFNAQSIK